MSEQRFDVVFFGILQPGKDKDVVMQNMATMFKTETSKLAPYFAGGRKVIKGNVDTNTAEKYQAALENVGLVIKLEPYETAQSESETAPTKATPETAAKAQNSTPSDNSQIDTSGFSIAPVGVNIIENPVEVITQKIDNISDITMAEAGVNVIENPVEANPQEIDDISGITMAEVGSDVLEHPVKVAAQKIDDISDISLAEAGADLIANPKAEEQADIPDTSELSLDENAE
ncbi:MAG: hypothetical protein ACC650_01460 [Gammaproteobacteria bacterium]